MKQSSRISTVILMLIISFSACKEDVYIDWKIKNEQWLEINKNAPGVITTPSGLQYKVLYQGWIYSRKPNKNSTVSVKFEGRLIDGSVFSLSKTDTISLQDAIQGWKEGIPKMNDGGNYTLYIPCKLGYDTATNKANIPPYSTLIFDVELIDSQY